MKRFLLSVFSLFIFHACSLPNSQQISAYLEIYAKLVDSASSSKKPLKRMDLTIDSMANMYIGYNIHSRKYVVFDFKKINETTLQVFMGEAKDPLKAVERIKETNMLIKVGNISRGGYFTATPTSGSDQIIFSMDLEWQSFSARFAEEYVPTILSIYRINDPKNPHVFE